MATSVDEIRVLARSSSQNDRLRACGMIQAVAGKGRRCRELLAIARDLIPDENNDVRWQACIAAAEFIDTFPDEVWAIVEEYGVSADEDMRTAMATVLLEHILEFNSDEYFGRCTAVIRLGDTKAKRMKDTLKRCAFFGKTQEDAAKSFLEGLRDDR